jgi:acetoacetyl-CoA synthetase
MKGPSTQTLLWQPSSARKAEANITRYINWLSDRRNLKFNDYGELWDWSVTRIEDFWQSIWEYFDVKASTPYNQILSSHEMPGAHWFAGSTLNYAEHVFRGMSDSSAIMSQSETRPLSEVTWAKLRRDVAAISGALKSHGIKRGDRVAAYVSNIPEAVVAFLACASLGVIWSSCSPDFGVSSVTDRFGQIEPKVLVAVDGYKYGGKPYDRLSTVQALQNALPGLKLTVLIPHIFDDIRYSSPNTVSWQTLLEEFHNTDLAFEEVSFEHPLWILYTSGTTGPPKPIVQGLGGILLEHFKAISFHLDLNQNDRFFWFTTTGWMMWNFLVSGLLNKSSIILYDGSP